MKYQLYPFLFAVVPTKIVSASSSRITLIILGDAYELFQLKCDHCGCYPCYSKYTGSSWMYLEDDSNAETNSGTSSDMPRLEAPIKNANVKKQHKKKLCF